VFSSVVLLSVFVEFISVFPLFLFFSKAKSIFFCAKCFSEDFPFSLRVWLVAKVFELSFLNSLMISFLGCISNCSELFDLNLILKFL
jgi:hypothetical protein